MATTVKDVSAMEDLVQACEDRVASPTPSPGRAVRCGASSARRAAPQQAADEAEAALRAAGWTDDEIRGAGVGFASVKAAMRRPPAS